MPFSFLRRRDKPEPSREASAADPRRSRPGIPFDGLTEEWRLIGVMHIDGRLSDALNKRESIAISDVQWAPIDGSAGFEPAPGLRSVDPYDLIVVLASAGTRPPLTEDEKIAYKVHKIAYDVALEAPPFRVIGTVYLYPGTEPARLLDRATEMFIPVVDAATLLGDREIDVADAEAVLVNRFYLRGVEQVDKRTRDRVQPLPGQPLGGVSWTDKGR